MVDRLDGDLPLLLLLLLKKLTLALLVERNDDDDDVFEVSSLSMPLSSAVLLHGIFRLDWTNDPCGKELTEQCWNAMVRACAFRLKVAVADDDRPHWHRCGDGIIADGGEDDNKLSPHRACSKIDDASIDNAGGTFRRVHTNRRSEQCCVGFNNGPIVDEFV